MRFSVLVVAATTMFGFATASQAQLSVTTGSPAANVISAPVSADIVVDFDSAVNTSTVDASSFRVFGRWSGPAPGTLTFENGDTRVRFDPQDSFMAGEWVVVSLSSAVESATGSALTTGYTWGFWTAAARGMLDFEFLGTVDIRNNGEGAIVSYGAYAGDLDDDGYSDLLVPNENPNDVRIFMNDGSGSYPTTFSTYSLTGGGRPSPNEGADFNNDGFVDVAVGGLADTKVTVLLGDGSGSFPTITGYDSVNDIRGVCVADYDADGDDDIITVGRAGNAMGLMTNDGTGAFTSGGTVEVGNGETSCVAADANNDGIADVFVGSFQGDEVQLLLGDGAGGFATSDSVAIPGSGQGSAWMLAAGDINGDGNADVASVNANRNTVSIIFGDGAGGLQAPVNYATGQFALAVDLGDVDGDGDLDMAVSNHTDAEWHLFENVGSGVFNSTPIVYDAGSRAACAIFHDRDNNGTLDMTGIDEGSDQLFFFRTTPDDTAIEDLPSYGGAQLSHAYPNPFSDQTRLELTLEASQHVTAQLFDVLGREVRVLLDEIVQPGVRIPIDVAAPDLAEGVYFVRVTGDSFVLTRPLTRSDTR